MPKELGQPKHEMPTSDDLGVLELKANLNPEQREHLEVLKAKMKKILGTKTKFELAKAGDLTSLINYRSVLKEILEFLQTKKIKDDEQSKKRKSLIFKSIEELEDVYQPDQIAHNKNEVGEDTKVYIGELYPEIFNKLPKNVEHIYTSFPDGKIVQKVIKIGGKNIEELTNEIKTKGYKITDYAEKELMGSNKFMPLKNPEKLNLVILSVKDLGFPNGATSYEIYEKAQAMGLKTVPAEVGPQLRLQYEDQLMDADCLIGSEPIRSSSGNISVFDVQRTGLGYSLNSRNVESDRNWHGAFRWVFARPS